MTNEEFKNLWNNLTKEEKRNIMEMALMLARVEIVYSQHITNGQTEIEEVEKETDTE